MEDREATLGENPSVVSTPVAPGDPVPPWSHSQLGAGVRPASAVVCDHRSHSAERKGFHHR